MSNGSAVSLRVPPHTWTHNHTDGTVSITSTSDVAGGNNRVVHNFQSMWRIGWSRWGNIFTNFYGITHQNCTKVGGTNDMSRWRNRPAPPLADNPGNNKLKLVTSKVDPPMQIEVPQWIKEN